MSWFKQHPTLSAAAALSLLAIGGLAYFALAAAQQYSDAVTAFNTEARQLDALKKQIPFPNQQNQTALAESHEAYKNALASFTASLAQVDEAPNDVSPQRFQDELRKAVDEISAEALKKNVGLPQTFYLGFDEFRARLPSKEEAPKLNTEFLLLKKLVTALIALPIDSLDALERLPSAPAGGTQGPISFNRFRITFSAPQDILIAAFNTIARNERFLLIRSISLENSNPTPPAKNAAAGNDAQASPPPPRSPHPRQSARTARSASPEPSQVGVHDSEGHFQVVLGSEFATASLLVDIPTFPKMPVETPAKAQKP